MSRKVQLGIAVGVVVCALIVVVVFRGGGGPGDSDKLSKVSVRLAWLPGATFTGDYVAVQKGYWEEEGLDVTLNAGGFEYDAIKLVASGVDTFGISSGTQILQARASGVPIVAIGAVIPRSPIGWVSKKGSGITKPQDFVGKKIGAQFGTHTEITLEALCAKLGIDLESFERIPVKFDPRLFVVDEIDVLPVYIIDQPVDLVEQGIELNIIDPGDYGVSLAFGNAYFTSEETVRDKPDLVRAFLRGAKRGWVWSKDNPQEAIDILGASVPDANKKTLRGKLDATLNFIVKERPEYPGVFPMDSADWKTSLDILTRHGNLDEPVDVSACFTNAFLTSGE